ncbi:HNH endonuclease [Enterobacter hormaechei]
MSDLSHERLLQLLEYDELTGVFIRKVRTSASTKKGERAGFNNGDGYLRVMVDGKRYLLHRLAWFYVHKRWPKNVIDHINGDGSDNRIANLREADPEQNSRNSRLRVDNKSGAKGASYHKRIGMWIATARLNGKQVHLGAFKTKEEAISVSNQFRTENHKEFCNLGSAEDIKRNTRIATIDGLIDGYLKKTGGNYKGLGAAIVDYISLLNKLE